MEKKLKALFDFQRFSENPRLAQIIADTENRYENVLSDEQLETVSAAGEAVPQQICEDKPDD